MKEKVETTKVEDTVTLLKLGMRVTGLWPAAGEWYNETVLAIFRKRKTYHIKYDDRDEDDDISWDP